MQGAVRATIQQCRTFYKYAWFSTSVRSLFLCPPGGKYPNQARWLAHQGLQFLESGAEEYCIPHCDESWKSIVLELGQCEDTWPFAKPNQWFQLVSYVSIFASKTPIANQDASVQLAKLAQKSDLVSRGIPRVSCIYYRVQHDSTISLVCVCSSLRFHVHFLLRMGGLCEFRTPPAWVSPIFEAFGRSNKWEGCERTLPKHLT
jgi:hypothetical protein